MDNSSTPGIIRAFFSHIDKNTSKAYDWSSKNEIKNLNRIYVKNLSAKKAQTGKNSRVFEAFPLCERKESACTEAEKGKSSGNGVTAHACDTQEKEGEYPINSKKTGEIQKTSSFFSESVRAERGGYKIRCYCE